MQTARDEMERAFAPAISTPTRVVLVPATSPPPPGPGRAHRMTSVRSATPYACRDPEACRLRRGPTRCRGVSRLRRRAAEAATRDALVVLAELGRMLENDRAATVEAS
jgi:hypothetical protein